MKRRLMSSGTWGLMLYTMLFVMAAVLLFGTDANAGIGDKEFHVVSGSVIPTKAYYTGTWPAANFEIQAADTLAHLTKDTDYTVTFSGGYEAGDTAVMTVTGINSYEDYKPLEFSIPIERHPLINPNTNTTDFGAMLTGTYTYSGEAIEPEETDVILYWYTLRFDEGDHLTLGTDYRVKGYENNINAGTGYVIVEGLGNYCGEKKIGFILLQR